MKRTKGFLAYLLSTCLIAVFPCVASLTHADTKENVASILSIDKELKADRDAGKGNVPVDDAAKAKIQKAYGKLPLYFIRNNGQVDKQVMFYEKGSGHATFFTKEGVYLVLGGRLKAEGGKLEAENIRQNPKSKIKNLKSEMIRLFPLGANKDPEIIAEGQQAGKVNYFIGNDPEKWKTDIPTYRAVVYKEIYPGIDMKFYGSNREFEYDIIIQPGADPSTVRLSYEGIESLRVTDEGELEIGLKVGKIFQKRPYIYQVIAGKRVEVEGNFVTPNRESSLVEDSKNTDTDNGDGQRSYGFQLASYNKDHPIVIDPVLVYSTYLGGSGDDYSNDIAIDDSGNAYLTGHTYSTDFPTQNPLQPDNAGGWDVFITKITPGGDALVYSTYLGGSDLDGSSGIAVDSSGNAYLTGLTSSTDFPTRNPLQPDNAGSYTAFVTKINPSGDALVYSTYLGGSSWDEGDGIAVDGSGNAYLTGGTWSTDFPTQNPLQPNKAGLGDAFVTKISPTGDALVYSTYLGGSDGESGQDIAVDSAGNAYLTGATGSTDFPTQNPFQSNHGGGSNDAFVTKISPAGDALVYSTYLGGRYGDSGDAIAVDNSGNAYLTGDTDSTDFPTRNPLQPDYGGGSSYYGGDAFVTKINSSGDALVYSTYLGGSEADKGQDISVDSAGNAYLTGYTESINFPTQNPLQPNHGGGYYDAFVTKISPLGEALVYSTYFGGSSTDRGYGIAVDSAGSAYLTGKTVSTDFPTLNPLQPDNAGSGDVFVTKIAVEEYTITATSDWGGKISPSGDVIVDAGTDQSFTITPSRGFRILDVVVDGVSVGAVSTYTFSNVTSDHTIHVTFRRGMMGRRDWRTY